MVILFISYLLKCLSALQKWNLILSWIFFTVTIMTGDTLILNLFRMSALSYVKLQDEQVLSPLYILGGECLPDYSSRLSVPTLYEVSLR